MKKLILLIAAILTMNLSTFSQSTNKLNIGIFTSGNFLSHTAHYYKLDNFFPNDDNTEMTGGALNASLGFTGNIPLSSSFSFSPRLGYTKLRGLLYSAYTLPTKFDTVQILSQTAETRFYFVTTDFLMKYYLPLGQMKRCTVYGGLRTDFLLWDDARSYASEPVYNGMHKINFSYLAGLGFDFGKRSFFGLEYSHNLNYFSNNNEIWIKYFSVSAKLGFFLL